MTQKMPREMKIGGIGKSINTQTAKRSGWVDKLPKYMGEKLAIKNKLSVIYKGKSVFLKGNKNLVAQAYFQHT